MVPPSGGEKNLNAAQLTTNLPLSNGIKTVKPFLNPNGNMVSEIFSLPFKTDKRKTSTFSSPSAACEVRVDDRGDQYDFAHSNLSDLIYSFAAMGR